MHRGIGLGEYNPGGTGSMGRDSFMRLASYESFYDGLSVLKGEEATTCSAPFAPGVRDVFRLVK